MERVKLLLVGGFLGAGKTTLLYRAATELMKSGRRVGLVTNDQAPDLVDTQMLAAHGLAVSEVAGSCFCCNFNGLIEAARSLQASNSVDVLLAEPVGSCTDLSATILQPLKDRYADVFAMGPLSVLIDPLRAREILGEIGTALHPGAAYIYRKQLEEADRIVVNKSDLLDPDARERLRTVLESQFPGREVSFVSCKTGDGLSDWLAEAMGEGASGSRILDIDYDTYAEGEAALGWLNARFELAAGAARDWIAFSRAYLEAVRGRLQSIGAPVGHVKLFLRTSQGSLTANLTATDGPVLLQHTGAALNAPAAQMTFNARVQIAPEQLQQVSLETLREHFRDIAVQAGSIRSLRPGRPQPTFRYLRKV